MRNSINRGSASMVLGLGLVVLGGWLLIERVLGPLLWPLRSILHGLGRFGWPLALVVIGVLLLNRTRNNSEGGTMPVYQSSSRALARSRSNRVVAGVLAGFADFFGWSPSNVRLVYVLLTVLTGVWPGIFAYVFAAIFMPEQVFGSATVVTPPMPPYNATATAPTPPAPPAPPAS